MPKNLFKDDPRVRIVDYVYETDDYDFFENLNGNRDVCKNPNLKRSMEENGFMNIPVVINEKKEIGDGQHRTKYGKELHLPCRFVVQPGMDVEQTAKVNNAQNKWKTGDYVHKGVATKNVDYERFQALSEKFPFARTNTIYVAMAANLTGGGIDKVIREGRLICSEEQYEEACKMLSWLETFVKDLKNTKGTKNNFYCAMMFVRRIGIIDVPTLTQRVKSNFDFSSRINSIEETVEKIENACNFKVAMSNRVYFTEEYKKAVALSNSRAQQNFKR